MNDSTRYGTRADPNLASLFWSVLRAHDDPPRPMTPDDVRAVWQIVRLVQPAEAHVRECALFARESSTELPQLASILGDATTHAQASTDAQPPLLALAAHAMKAGQLALSQNQPQGAEPYLRCAVSELHLLGEKAQESRAQVELGHALQLQGKLGEARQSYHNAYELDLASGHHFNQGTDLALLAEVARLAEQYAESISLARQALAIHRRFGNRLSASGALVTLGLSHRARGHPLRAWWYLAKARRHAKA